MARVVSGDVSPGIGRSAGLQYQLGLLAKKKKVKQAVVNLAPGRMHGLGVMPEVLSAATGLSDGMEEGVAIPA